MKAISSYINPVMRGAQTLMCKSIPTEKIDMDYLIFSHILANFADGGRQPPDESETAKVERTPAQPQKTPLKTST
jgi:hypothetical protein